MRRLEAGARWCATLLAAAAVAACGGESKRTVQDAPDMSGVGGRGAGSSAGAIGGTGTGVGTPGGTSPCSSTSGDCCPGGAGRTTLLPNRTGWIDRADLCNDVGIQGGWHVYGDGYTSADMDAPCINAGGHRPSECAQIRAPEPPPVWGFVNSDGNLHMEATSEKILPCVAGSMASLIPTSGCPGNGMAGGFDFNSMRGAGMGLDFNADAGPPDGAGTRHAWDPSAYGIVGVSFVIDQVPAAGMRVEFPILLTDSEAAADFPPITAENPTSEQSSAGSPYWGAQLKGDRRFPNSPIVAGENIVTWDQVMPPGLGVYVFDTSRLIGIRFHVPTTSSASAPYQFTVSTLSFLRRL